MDGHEIGGIGTGGATGWEGAGTREGGIACAMVVGRVVVRLGSMDDGSKRVDVGHGVVTSDVGDGYRGVGVVGIGSDVVEQLDVGPLADGVADWMDMVVGSGSCGEWSVWYATGQEKARLVRHGRSWEGYGVIKPGGCHGDSGAIVQGLGAPHNQSMGLL